MTRLAAPRLSLATAPAEEPLTTAEAKAHLRVDHSSEDAYIDALVKAARLGVEDWTGRSLVTQTWDLQVARFPSDGCPIALPKPPLISVTSITYVDPDGESQVWASSNYSVDAPAGEFAQQGLIVPDFNTEYPSTQSHLYDVTVRFVAGYGDAEDVPAGILEAMRLMIANWYDNRSDAVAGTVFARQPTVTALLTPYRAFTARGA